MRASCPDLGVVEHTSTPSRADLIGGLLHSVTSGASARRSPPMRNPWYATPKLAAPEGRRKRPRKPADAGQMVVGHNPAFGELVWILENGLPRREP